MDELKKAGYKVISRRYNKFHDRYETWLAKGNKNLIYYEGEGGGI